jgi:ATP-dependent Clp protease ATP-binding subunit ClpA
MQVVGLMIKDVQSRIVERGITFELTPEASDWLGREGFDPVYGARPLRRAIQRFLVNPLSKGILAGDFQEGNRIIVDAGDTGLSLCKAVGLAV